jgi:hypothetical protein
MRAKEGLCNHSIAFPALVVNSKVHGENTNRLYYPYSSLHSTSFTPIQYSKESSSYLPEGRAMATATCICVSRSSESADVIFIPGSSFRRIVFRIWVIIKWKGVWVSVEWVLRTSGIFVTDNGYVANKK